MKKKLPMNKDTLDTIKDIFGGDIYKMPDARDKDPDNILGHLKEAKVFDAEMFAYSFDKLKWDSGSGQYKFTIGDFVDEEVVCFGYNEKVYKHSKAYNLQQEKEAVYTHTEIVPVYYKYKRNKNGTFTVYTEGADGIRCKDENGKEFDYSKEMDAHMFMLFITGKRLEPKTSKEIQEQKDIHTDKNDPDRKFHRKKARFSINNLL